MLICPSFHYSKCNAVCDWICYHIIRMNQVNYAERVRFEGLRIKPPVTHLIKEVILRSPIFYSLKVTIKTSSAIFPYLMNMNLSSCFGKNSRSRKAGKTRPEYVHSFTHVIPPRLMEIALSLRFVSASHGRRGHRHREPTRCI